MYTLKVFRALWKKLGKKLIKNLSDHVFSNILIIVSNLSFYFVAILFHFGIQTFCTIFISFFLSNNVELELF